MQDHGPDVIRKRNMLTVTTEQEKALYLRAFTAGVLNHTYGGWNVLPDSAYSGEYACLQDWLDSCLETSGFFGKRSYTMTEVSDAREERALSSFLWKLIRSRPKHTLLQNLKRRYRRI